MNHERDITRNQKKRQTDMQKKQEIGSRITSRNKHKNWKEK